MSTILTVHKHICVSTAMKSDLMIFINQVATYFESHTESVNIFCGQNTDYLHADGSGT